jgi:hypothetical protein
LTTRYLDTVIRVLMAARTAFLIGARRARIWLSVPVNFCIAAIGAVFLVSFMSWAIGYCYSPTLLYFPDGRTGRLRGEVRDLPRKWLREPRAELVASEILLGPRSPALAPGFSQGSRVESVIFRRSVLYVDISADAALDDPKSLRIGLQALRRSLEVAVPGARVAITIGGYEPYLDGLKGGSEAKTVSISASEGASAPAQALPSEPASIGRNEAKNRKNN